MRRIRQWRAAALLSGSIAVAMGSPFIGGNAMATAPDLPRNVDAVVSMAKLGPASSDKTIAVFDFAPDINKIDRAEHREIFVVKRYGIAPLAHRHSLGNEVVPFQGFGNCWGCPSSISSALNFYCPPDICRGQIASISDTDERVGSRRSLVPSERLYAHRLDAQIGTLKDSRVLQLTTYQGGLSFVNAPLQEADYYKDSSEGGTSYRRAPLSVRHPAWFGFGVILVAVIGACAAVPLGFYGVDLILGGERRKVGAAMLGVGFFLFLTGFCAVPIAWLLGLVD